MTISYAGLLLNRQLIRHNLASLDHRLIEHPLISIVKCEFLFSVRPNLGRNYSEMVFHLIAMSKARLFLSSIVEAYENLILKCMLG